MVFEVDINWNDGKDHPTVPFTFLRTFLPFGRESRDIGQFIDDDGTAYLIFEDRASDSFPIAKLWQTILM